jgi:gluconate 5-dehydrogenase
MAVDLALYQKMFKLQGTTALVTGGAGGIGSAISAGLAALGCRVFLTARTEQKAEEVARPIREAGGDALGLPLNVETLSDIKQFSSDLHKRVPKVDVFVNCIGTHIEAPAEKYTEEAWDHIFNVNLKAAFFLSQEIANHQIGAGGGKHIHITSVRSSLGISRGYISYCTTRGGMNMMVKQLATEWAKYGITVNGIAPTFTRTSLVAQYLDDPVFYKSLVERIPLGRVCDPNDIAGLAMFLASHASDFINGQIIFVDGGLTATQ